MDNSNKIKKPFWKIALRVLIIIVIFAIIFCIGLLITINTPIAENNAFLSSIKNSLFPNHTFFFFPSIDKTSKSNTRESYEGGNFDETLKMCTPKLGENMVGVYWSDGEKNTDGTYKVSYTSTKIEVTSEQKDFSWRDWYDYVGVDDTIDHKLSTWANAKSTTDGSYFVWIPRFEYKLTNEHSSQVGTITVNFIDASQTTPSSDEFKIHPAFTNGNGNYDNGQWDSEIPGFWVAKYEMSMELSTDNDTWDSIQGGYISSSKQGNVLTSSVINKTNSGKITSFIQYPDLTDNQIQKIANLCKQEQGSVEGAAAEASLMANIFELNNYSKLTKYGPGGSGLYTYIRLSGWWTNSEKIMDGANAGEDYVEAVKSVLVDGKRTLPMYVDEHDDIGDISTVTNDGNEIDKSDSSQYIQFKSIITQDPKRITGGSTYTYYCHIANGSDPFGYSNERNRTRYGEFHYDFSTGKAIKSSSDEKSIRAVSKPDVYAWNYISIDKAYQNSKLYDESNQSHLIKNSEWGAVAYLAHSQYGRNGRKIGMNTNYFSILGYSKRTGYGASNISATPWINDNNRYNGTDGMNASTTGNLYGVYDLIGGNNEYVAAYFSQHENTTNYGKSLVEETSNSKSSTKYVTIYPGETATISECYDLWSEIYGDAIYETSSQAGGNSSWFLENADTDSEENEPFILRGGSYKDSDSAGLFSFNDNEGVKNYENSGYRVVLISK